MHLFQSKLPRWPAVKERHAKQLAAVPDAYELAPRSSAAALFLSGPHPTDPPCPA